MNIKSLVITALSVFTLSSCSFHYGTTSAGSALITDENFNLDFAYGTAKTTKILGVGSFNREGLVLDAKKDLYTNYPLKPGQALGHVTVDFKTTFVLVFSTTKVTISAEIIDFSKPSQKFDQTKKNLNDFINSGDDVIETAEQEKYKTSNFKIGDQVQFKIDGVTKSGSIKGAENNLLLINATDGKEYKIPTTEVFQ